MSKLRGKILESQPLKQRMLKERKWAFKTPLYIKIVIKLLVLGTLSKRIYHQSNLLEFLYANSRFLVQIFNVLSHLLRS